jgi:hypothetical protein
MRSDEQSSSSRDATATMWWHRPAFIAVLTTLVGAMVPVAAGVQGYIQKDREIELEREKHKQSIRLHYLDVLVDSSLKDVELFLSFVSETDDSPELKRWAVAQLGTIRRRIEDLEKDRVAADKRATDAERELALAREDQKKIEERLKQVQAQARSASASEASLKQKAQLEEASRLAQTAIAQAQRAAVTRRAEVTDKEAALSTRRRPPVTLVEPSTRLKQEMRAFEQRAEMAP